MVFKNSPKSITSLQHPLVKHLVKLRQNRDYREEQESTVIYGNKIVKELGMKFSLKKLLIKEGYSKNLEISAEQVFYVTENILKKISGVLSCEDLLAEITLPRPSPLHNQKKILCLDGISDPGNLGSLIRTAMAFNWEGICLLPNSVDPFNDKAIRASKGTCFQLPCWHLEFSELRKMIEHNGFTVFIADLKGEPLPKVSIQDKKILLVLGSESHGVSESMMSIGKKITIPISNQVESLNVSVAGGILMHYLS